jgi:hypothetical protein
VNSAADNNVFETCIFECHTAFELSDYTGERNASPGENLTDGTDQDFYDNLFVHCNFIGVTFWDGDSVFIHSAREADGNELINCIVYGFDTFLTGSDYPANQPPVTPFDDPLGFDFDYCCFHNPGSDFPDESTLGSENIDDDPDFSEFFDYNLNSGSPCDNEGAYLGGVYLFDLNGGSRGNPPDIGAQEAP